MLFQSKYFKERVSIELQIWFASIMKHNERSHYAYDVARAATPKAV